MLYVTHPDYVFAVQFSYTESGIAGLQEFTNGAVTRHGATRTPATGPWAYIKQDVPSDSTEHLIVDSGDYVFRDAITGALNSASKIEFLNKYRIDIS